MLVTIRCLTAHESLIFHGTLVRFAVDHAFWSLLKSLTAMNNPATTLQQIQPLLPVRLFNGFGALLEKTQIRSTRMFATDLIETAKRRCGLDDFGEGEFFEALSRLLQSCQDEARLNLIGKIALKVDVLETLCVRLQMERDRQVYPDIPRQEIREPLFIVGLPRSGTSVLHRLLGADPEHRSPLMWEVRSPCPPTRDEEKRRIQRATQSCNFFNWLVPTFRYVHTVGDRSSAGMRQPHDADVFERSVRCDVLCAVISRLVFSAGFAAGIRVSSKVPSTSAVSASRSPMDPESAYSHVCRAFVVVRLSGCAVRADPPDADRCDGVCVESSDNSTQCVQRCR